MRLNVTTPPLVRTARRRSLEPDAEDKKPTLSARAHRMKRIIHQNNDNKNRLMTTSYSHSRSTSSSSRSKSSTQSVSGFGGLTLSVSTIEREENELEQQKDMETINNMMTIDHSGDSLEADTFKLRAIGSGVSSTVYLGIHISTLRLVAVKEQNVSDKKEEKRLMHELHATHRNLVPISGRRSSQCFNHVQAVGIVNPCPFIVSFYGAWSNKDKMKVSLVMEYMDSGALDSIVEKGGTQSEVVLQRMAYCGLKGLSHLHKHRTIHRDVKPANLLMSHQGIVKVADLGLAKQAKKGEDLFEEQQGTVAYFSPERIEGQPYSYSADIWGFGATLLALAIGEDPFSAKNKIFGLRQQILEADVDKILSRAKGVKTHVDGKKSEMFSKEFRGVLKKMMSKDPKLRGSPKELLMLPFFMNNPIGIPIYDRVEKTFKDLFEGKEGTKSFFREEWNRTMKTLAMDGSTIIKGIKTIILENKRASSHFVSTVKKIRTRSQRNLMEVQPSMKKRFSITFPLMQNMMKKTASKPKEKRNTGHKKVPTPIYLQSQSVNTQIVNNNTFQSASVSGLVKAKSEPEKRRSRSSKGSSEESEVEQHSLWKAFEDLAVAVGLSRAEVMKELKDLQRGIAAKADNSKTSQVNPLEE
eukprot:CAMPEP_0167752938 /NCGR_PEP_ID=MMETSP0110_2-20121227/7425_1 /TAXON_ID=629695 /ORGANISM="Gymnochlora sp., Strain CCMP2014" /LENGTH=638 /DNA_ID=CAMNT_0007638627 /DNA_START=82 /DNA_END=1998 /DNA_ORIENTATION=+